IERHGADLVEEDRLGYARMLEVRDGKLADAEIPVGMARPLDIELVAQIERQSHAFALQFVHDAAVVDAAHFDLAPIPRVEELRATFLQRRNVNDSDAKLALRYQKVRQCLLAIRIDLHEDDVLRIVTGDDQLA